MTSSRVLVLRTHHTVDGTKNVNQQPVLLTVDEAAALLRTTRKAVYAMIARRQLPGVTRIRRRVLFKAADLLDWLDQKCAPSQKE